jgi:UTP--glucose-1-phosphate uridylyltransferase
MADGLTAAMDKMRADGASDVAIETFRHYYERLASGETGTIGEDEIEPVGDLPTADDLPEPEDAEALQRAVMIRLNGGLGTSMGMTGPKSLVEAKDGLTFLDIIVRQVLGVRERHGVRLPLVLMNSFRTREPTLAALERYPELDVGLPLDFVQGRVPKIRADDLTPVEWPADPELEWTPPGHGDIYTSLMTSGMLATLLDQGFEYALMANSDNLGAVLDPRVLAWFAREELPFAMEVLRRSPADRKGGHIARRQGGGLVLRESAQVRDEDQDAFQDVGRHR